MQTRTAHGTPATVESLFRRLIDEGFNQGNLAVVDAIVSPAFAEHQRDAQGGIDGVKGTILFLRTAYPDFHLSIEATAVTGDTVWARMRGTGTNTRPMLGRPPTGKSFAIDVIDVCRAEHGQLVEHWGVPDQFGLLAQLGLLPAPSTPPPGRKAIAARGRLRGEQEPLPDQTDPS